MISHLLHLPSRQEDKVAATLAGIPRKTRTTSLRKWRKLFGLLRSITPAVAGSRIIFTQVQHALKRAAGRHIYPTTDVHDVLKAWRKLVCSLAIRPTHILKLEPFSSTWFGTTNA